MAEIIIIDISPRIQAVAGAGQTVFTYNFPVFDAGDLGVYRTPVGSAPDDVADLLIINEHYTVQGVNAQGGGTITLITPATAGDVITIERDMPLERLSDYNDAGSFAAASVNRDYDRDVMMSQQVNATIQKRGLLYRKTEVVPPGLNILPKLGASQFWKSAADGNSLLAVTLEEGEGWSALRSELASQTELAPGAGLVGYYDAKDAGMTVNTKLNSISNYLANISGRNLVIGGDFSANPWQRGINFANVANNQYTADRFKIIKVLGTGTVAVDKQPDSPSVAQSGFYSTHSLIVSVGTAQPSLTAGEYVAISHSIEGYNFMKIAQRTFTISFWARANKTGIYSCAVRNAGKDRSYAASITINAVDVWELKTITVPASPAAGTWNYTNAVGLELIITLACGSNFTTTPNSWVTGDYFAAPGQVNFVDDLANRFDINFIKVEPGIVATPFEPRSFGNELAMCQRYFAKTYDLAVPPGTAAATSGELIVRSVETGAGTLFMDWSLPVTARAEGITTVYSPVTGGANAMRNTDAGADIAASAGGGQNNVRATNTGGIIAANSHTAHFTHDAEL